MASLYPSNALELPSGIRNGIFHFLFRSRASEREFFDRARKVLEFSNFGLGFASAVPYASRPFVMYVTLACSSCSLD